MASIFSQLTSLFSQELQMTSFLLGIAKPRHKLENSARCGITTGGKEECYFDCQVFSSVDTSGPIVTNLECLKDCFPDRGGMRRNMVNCVNSLITDVTMNGICDPGFPLFPYDNGTEIFQLNTNCESTDFGSTITKGTCSYDTEKLLIETDCIYSVFEQPAFVRNTITNLILFGCTDEVSSKYTNLTGEISGQRQTKGQSNNVQQTRLSPSQSVAEFSNFTLRTILKYENTLHRYPWVCSLRSRGPTPQHLCAVTILSIPPKPTVVISAAHCTYICKRSQETPVPSCCCAEGPENCADDQNKCGDNPKVFLMTGMDAQILCGEFETGPAPSDLSGEKYNVILPINEIVRHPNFNTSEGAGPIDGSDIAVFKVDDGVIQNNRAYSLRIYPACLPLKKRSSSTGVHTGWSKPPPFHFVNAYAAGYARFYRDFFKQWHYKMDILDKCQDPQLNSLFGGPLEFQSNSFYPPATVCAKDFSRQSCFSTGDSGSPLMVREASRFYVEGILSFVKGCDVFSFGPVDEDQTKWQLLQQSENPSTYTKLSCFLPWIAKEYNMEFEYSGDVEEECYSSQGEKEEDEPCRNIPSNLIETFDGEVECIFPFYYNGKKFNECVLFDESDFVFPVFRCPTRNITTTINGVSSFIFADLNSGYCLSDPLDNTSPLDPNNQKCSPFARRNPLSQCKNNCPGVRAFGIIGGGAALAFLGAASGLSILGPVAGVAGVGAVGVAGVGMMAQAMCITPFCSVQGQCCLVLQGTNGLVCPDSC